MSRRWQRTLAVLGICLPVPLSAATGLSIPLPATVERLAAALVPWAQAATLDGNGALAPGAGGSIVLLPGEGRPVADIGERDVLRLLAAARAGETADADEEPAKKPKDKKEPTEPAPDGSDPGGSEPGTSDPGDEPDGDSGLVEDTVDEVGETTDPIVEAGEEVVGDIGGAVGDVEDAVDEVVGGLG